MPGNDGAGLHVALADMARELHSHVSQGPDDVLETITRAAVEVIPGAVSAGITLVDGRRRVQTVGATDADAKEFDRLQEANGDGPCLAAAWENQVVLVRDFGSDERWPALCEATLSGTAIRGSMSYRLYTSEHGIGALNLYADQPDAFSEPDVEAGYAYATHAAIVLDAAQRQQQFSSALASRDVIGQAKGMIMERFDVGPTRAFQLLQKLSQESNTPVAQLARRLVNTDHPDG